MTHHSDAARQPVFNAPAAVKWLIAVLAGVHLLLWVLGEDWQIWSLFALSFIPNRLTGGIEAIPGSQLWSFLSYGLLHADWMHLLFNSIWLMVFGTPVARYLGTARFLGVSAAATVGGAIASLALHWNEFVVMVGASGAVSGLLASAIPIMYGAKVPGGARPLEFRELLENRRALMFMAVWMGLTLFSGAWGWTGTEFAGSGRIAWEAHIGGFVGGLAAFYGLARRRVQ